MKFVCYTGTDDEAVVLQRLQYRHASQATSFATNLFQLQQKGPNETKVQHQKHAETFLTTIKTAVTEATTAVLKNFNSLFL